MDFVAHALILPRRSLMGLVKKFVLIMHSTRHRLTMELQLSSARRGKSGTRGSGGRLLPRCSVVVSHSIYRAITGYSSSVSLSMWYPRHELQFRIGLFWGGATVAGT